MRSLEACAFDLHDVFYHGAASDGARPRISAGARHNCCVIAGAAGADVVQFSLTYWYSGRTEIASNTFLGTSKQTSPRF